MELPENVCGKRVVGQNFYGRSREVERVWARLETDNVVLSAPRRVGKSSLMQQLLKEAPARHWQAVYMSAEDVGDEKDFVARLYAEVARAPQMEEVAASLSRQKAGEKLKNVSKLSVSALSVELRQQATTGWQELADALQESLWGLSPGRKLLLMVDELPVFLLALLQQSPQRAVDFLRWFRALRQGPVHRSDDLRWLVAGSVGLAPLARRERWSAHINDLYPFSLGAYSPDVADSFLEALSKRYDLGMDPALRALLLQKVGWPIPFYLQLFVSELRDRRPVTVQAIEAATESLLGLDARKHFAPWWERLQDELGATDASAARAILSGCAADPGGASRGTIRTLVEGYYGEKERDERRLWLMEVLEGDGYLVEDGERWRFRSPLLRAVWLRWSNR